MLTTIISVVGRIVLVLVILDYFGIGETLIGAVANGLTFTIAITLGLSFGRALEPDAQRIVGQVRSFLMQKKEETVTRRK